MFTIYTRVSLATKGARSVVKKTKALSSGSTGKTMVPSRRSPLPQSSVACDNDLCVDHHKVDDVEDDEYEYYISGHGRADPNSDLEHYHINAS